MVAVNIVTPKTIKKGTINADRNCDFTNKADIKDCSLGRKNRMNIKELFDKAEDGILTYDQFEALAKEMGAKFADLSDGKYVSKSKYESDLKTSNQQVESLNSQIEALNSTITTRDEDLANLQKQLELAGEDKAKLDELNASMTDLQAKYEADMQANEAKLHQQSYEFAVKEYANSQKFSSTAAKRDFIRAMIEKNLLMEGDKLIGGDDFRDAYAAENNDAFYVEKEPELPAEPELEDEPEPTEPSTPIPTFVASTSGAPQSDEDTFDFGFVGVRAHE